MSVSSYSGRCRECLPYLCLRAAAAANVWQIKCPIVSVPRKDNAGVWPHVRSAQRAVRRVDDALAVVRQLEAEPRMRQWLRQSKGVLIIPAYGRAAMTHACFGRGLSPHDSAAGKVSYPQSQPLQQALAATTRPSSARYAAAECRRLGVKSAPLCRRRAWRYLSGSAA